MVKMLGIGQSAELLSKFFSIREISDKSKGSWEPDDKTHALAKKLIKDREIDPPLDCSGCHR